MKKDKNVKSFLHWYLWGGLCAFFLFYVSMQYLLFKNAYYQNFLKEVSTVENCFQNILQNYKVTLEKISNEIRERDLFSDEKFIADHLRKAYAYGIENESRENVRALGLNWVGVEGANTVLIGRWGAVKYKLNFTPEYLSKLEKNWGIVVLSTVLQEGDSVDFPVINLGIGVQDAKKIYRGFVNARIDLNALREMLSPKQGSGFQFILLDEKGHEVMSSLPTGEAIKETLGVMGYFKNFFEGHFFPQQYVFPVQFPVSGFSYVLRCGYDQEQLCILFLKQNYLSLLLAYLFFLLFACVTYFYHKKFMKKSLRFYKEKDKKKNKIVSQLTEENYRLIGREKTLEKYIKSSEEADKEEKKFCLEINKRISSSLSKMLDIANFLLSRIEEKNNIEDNSKELMEVFEDTYTHSRFFTLKREEEFVSINEVLDEALVIHSKQILRKNIQIKYPQKKIVALLTDRTALKQTLINIIGRTIKNSPKKAEIGFSLFSQGEEVCLEFRDNGYLGEHSLKELSAPEEKNLSLDSMSLTREDLEKLVKSLGGTLSTSHKPYKGNTFLLQLPYQVTKDTGRVTTINDNIVSFSAVKKKR